MQQNGWILFALVVLGPLAGVLLLDRLRVGRAASIAGLLALALGALGLALYSTNVVPGVSGGEPVAAGSGSAFVPSGPSQASSTAAGAASRPARVSVAPPQPPGPEVAALREQLATLGTERDRIAEALVKARAELEAERGQGARARQELATARGHLAGLGAAASRSDPASARLPADAEAERATHAKAREELRSARDRIASLEAANAKTADAAVASVLVVLESERGAHEKSRVALRAVEAQVAALEASRQRLEAELREAVAGRKAAQAEADAARARLAGAGADAKHSDPPAPPPREQVVALAAPPKPFSASAPPAVTPPVASVASVAPAAPAASPLPAAASALRGRMDGGLAMSGFTLQRLPIDELVQGQAGSYYRVVCREAAGKRLIFDSGAYSITGGDAKVDPCFKALQAAVLSSLPAGIQRSLYVQGHASTQGFARPQRFPTTDTHLKSLSFLPKTKDGQQFVAKAAKQSVGTAFSNRELPVLRAGAIGDWVETATKGSVTPQLLEGDFKETADEASRSFDLVLYVRW